MLNGENMTPGFLHRKLDFVFCVDATEGPSCSKDIKQFIHRFIDKIIDYLTEYDNVIDSVHAGTILFRDYLYDGQNPVCASPFFELPLEADAFDATLSPSSFYGGGPSGKRNGMEALYQAMRSDFTADGTIDRQIIVLLSNNDCYSLQECSGKADYPSDMVDETGFINTWYCFVPDAGLKLCEKNKRLVIFAPDGTKYQELKAKLTRSVFCPVKSLRDLKEIDIDDIIKIISWGVGVYD